MSIDGSFPKRPAVQGILPGDVRTNSDRPVPRRVGWFPASSMGRAARILGPELYGELFRDVTVAPGEVKDLGDLKIVPPRRDGQQ